MPRGSTTTQSTPPQPPAVARRLAWFFRRQGYVRWQNEERVTGDGHRIYKKGNEVRFIADTPEELAEIRWLLAALEFDVGRSFVKGAKFRQPVYGKGQVARLLDLVDEVPDE